MLHQLPDKNYEQQIKVHCSKNDAFDALTQDIDKWWGHVDQAPKVVGDIFRITFGGESYWEFEIIEFSRPDILIWKCVNSHQGHNLKGIDEEWLNTRLEWRMTEVNENTEIRFIHFGLLPKSVCYEVCSVGWDFYITKSLIEYLENGVGQPLGQ